MQSSDSLPICCDQMLLLIFLNVPHPTFRLFSYTFEKNFTNLMFAKLQPPPSALVQPQVKQHLEKTVLPRPVEELYYTMDAFFFFTLSVSLPANPSCKHQHVCLLNSNQTLLEIALFLKHTELPSSCVHVKDSTVFIQLVEACYLQQM